MDNFYEIKCLYVHDLNNHSQDILEMISNDWEQVEVNKFEGFYLITYVRYSELFKQLEEKGFVSRAMFKEGDKNND
ncbi:hypothetical protein GHU05_07070 [Fructobacillus tropaeoli]|uniref:hypothetical protein n=1 Tax=Fructobacillus tropaeoli TaxID=709323 RepID=UPI00145618CC|nr:hypothetical protein [Fructobacillus tropaeoli]NLS38681.1 hypothetical protein [Fructobacillus tropaeoli]